MITWLTDHWPLITGHSLLRFRPELFFRRPVAAQQNYTAAQARMKRDPKLAQLLLRPTAKATHPRKIFDENSPEADVIRQWATQFSSQ